MPRVRIEPSFAPIPIAYEGDADDDDGYAAAPPIRIGRILRTAGRVAGAGLAIFGLSVFARETIRTAPPRPAAAEPLAVAYVPLSDLPVRPVAAAEASAAKFALEGSAPGLDAVLEREGQQSRGNAVSEGAFPAIEAPYLRLTVSEGVAAGPPPNLFVTLARRAAEPGLSVTRTGERERIATKFGAVETLETTLVGGSTRICAGFQTVEAAPLRVDGWLCAPLGLPPEPASLACALDRLTLAGNADPATRAVFAETEGRRLPACRKPGRRPDGKLDAAGTEPGAQTGSIVPERTRPRKIEAQLRRNAQAQP